MRTSLGVGSRTREREADERVPSGADATWWFGGANGPSPWQGPRRICQDKALIGPSRRTFVSGARPPSAALQRRLAGAFVQRHWPVRSPTPRQPLSAKCRNTIITESDPITGRVAFVHRLAGLSWPAA
jgi:hypothetical protein